ncbi:hypothetical protein FW778_17055 [Ginsengibacter hankyongi]|uniref:Uncharacterized protein n=1 Tax=Ginsengibacter hankyongi TaxID=2607284 RepID=A0A5J5IEU1_9BACT|nr:hypothetical protein [Ginsengibacter hankyongi]KAA9037137.1 hypothetical protein FW778_17055 [Ginsengibacter hankyongi]
MENKKEEFDYEALKKKTLSNFVRAKVCLARMGPFVPLLKDLLEVALRTELKITWMKIDALKAIVKMVIVPSN